MRARRTRSSTASSRPSGTPSANACTTWWAQTAGPTPDPRAFFPSINGNGTKVAFATQRSYDGADTNNTPDVYVSDGGTITLASRADGTTGAGGNGYTSGASMNKDGTQVAFASSSSNLVTGDVNGKEDVFVRNLSTGHTVPR